MRDRWAKLTWEQLRGAEYAYSVLRTSPRIRGAALELLDDLLREIQNEAEKRQQQEK